MPTADYPLIDRELSRRLERAEAHASARFVEARARTTPESGAEWIEVEGAYAMYDEAGSPINQTFGFSLFEQATERALGTIEAFFERHGAEPAHEVSPLAGLEAARLLSVRGYRPIEFTSVMFRPAQGGRLAAPDHVRVREIRSDEGELWARVTARGWIEEHPELAEYLSALGPLSTSREDAISLLAEVEGQAVGAAAFAVHDGVALLNGACTVLEARRQGVQRAMLAYRLDDAARRGCDLAMMCAEPGSVSQRNAERQGFRIAYTRIKWGRS